MRIAPPLISLSLLLLPACSAGTGRGSYLAGSPAWGPAPLVGGVTDDNARHPEYLTYVAAYPHGDVPKIDLTDRQVFTLLGSGDSLPLWDVPVSVRTPGGGFRTRTNASGQAILPRAALGIPTGTAATLWVGEQGGVATPLLAHADRAWVPGVWRRPVRPFDVGLDVALVVDTTNSMDDEVSRLRATLRSVVAGLEAHGLRPDVRVGGVAYRDVGDAYVTTPFDFTSDLGLVQRRLDEIRTGGGGDGPEAVQEALEVAVERLSWRGEGTLRVLFLVGDAPPHFERGTPYTVTLRRALERGITIHAVACSGMDDRGEFVWRQLAAVTLGKFLFVSYGGGTENHTGPYVENDLDGLMLRAVLEQLDALAGTHANSHVRAHLPPPCVPPAPLGALPSACGDAVGYGRAPWDFGIPGWPR